MLMYMLYMVFPSIRVQVSPRASVIVGYSSYSQVSAGWARGRARAAAARGRFSQLTY